MHDNVTLYDYLDNLARGELNWDAIRFKPAFIGAGDTAEDARGKIGAGTSNLEIGETETTAAAGNRKATPDKVGMVLLASLPVTLPPLEATQEGNSSAIDVPQLVLDHNALVGKYNKLMEDVENLRASYTSLLTSLQAAGIVAPNVTTLEVKEEHWEEDANS